MKNFKQRFVAFVAGVLLSPALVWAGLETGTYISDLVATNPLGSDLASTIDDHIRLLKSTIKATFPNINGAVSATDEELSLLAGKTGTVWTSANDGSGSTLDADLLDGVSIAGLGANPSATIGLSATNGSASTYLRSDGAPALSQSISPTWSGNHTFAGQLIAASGTPEIRFDETDAASDNRVWSLFAASEKLRFGAYDNNASAGNDFMTVDRTGTTVDKVTFPTEGSAAFVVGNAGGALNSARAQIRTTSAAASLQVSNATSGQATIISSNEGGSGDNQHIVFTEGISSRGSITYNRAGGVIAYNTTSDARLKDNIRDSKGALALIANIKIRAFDWKNQPGSKQRYWLVAQELAEVMPEAVSIPDRDEDNWSLDVSKLVPLSIKAVQEQQQEIQSLQNQVQQLLTRLTALERAGVPNRAP